MNIRLKALKAIAEHVGRAALAQHESKIQTLYVMPDGELFWHESSSDTDYLVLEGTTQPVASVFHSPLRGNECNCGDCRAGVDPKTWVETQDSIGYLQMDMESILNDIDQGYFFDELDDIDYDSYIDEMME